MFINHTHIHKHTHTHTLPFLHFKPEVIFEKSKKIKILDKSLNIYLKTFIML